MGLKSFTSILLVASLLATALAADPCTDGLKPYLKNVGTRYSALSLEDKAAYAALLKCYRAIMPTMPEDTKKQLIERVQDAASIYAFTDDLRTPPAGMDVQDGLDIRVDIPKEVNEISARQYKSAYDLFSDLKMPACFSNEIPVAGLPICPSEDNGEFRINVCPESTAATELLMTYLGKEFYSYGGKRITKINGQDAEQFLIDFANRHTLTGRDMSQRFELMLEIYINTPSLMGLAKKSGSHVDLDSLEVSSLDYTFADGTTLHVPIIALMSKTQSTAAEYASKCKNSMNTMGVSAYTNTQGITPLDVIELSRVPLENQAKMSLPVNDEFQPTTPEYELSAYASRLAEDPQVIEWNNAKSFNDIAAASSAPSNLEDVYFKEVDGVCMFVIDTFSPEGFFPAFAIQEWLRSLQKAAQQAKAAKCGVVTGFANGMPQGKPVVIDIRSNPGGYVKLLDIFFDGIFPDYTPHHTTVTSVRLASTGIDAIMRAYREEQVPIREPFTFKGTPACDGKLEASCPYWWRRNSRSRAMPDGTRSMWSPKVADGNYFWEVPKGDDYKSYLTSLEAKKKFGSRTEDMRIAMDVQAIGFKPAPELTTFLSGPMSASCGGQVMTRAKGYLLGASARTGSARHEATMGGLVPGGNIVSYSTTGSKLPYGAEVTFTSSATMPYTTAQAKISGEYTPMEFVREPPQFRVPSWIQSGVRSTDENMRAIVKSLKQPGMPLTVCTPGMYAASAGEGCPQVVGAAKVGRLCNPQTGKYDGKCGAALCSFFNENIDGECVAH